MHEMEYGCPVICSNTSSMPEVIGNCGIRIDPNKDEELLNAFEKMYFDENFRKECIEKGMERARQFSWEKSVDRMIQALTA